MISSRRVIYLFYGAFTLSNAAVHGFMPSPRSGRTCHSQILKPVFSSQFPPEEDRGEYTGDVDWDAEWKKVMANQDQPVERPGKNYYKSEAEIQTIKTVNRVSLETEKAKASLDISSLTNDWKFWIGILAFISIASSVISANSVGVDPSSISSPDSYYI